MDQVPQRLSRWWAGLDSSARIRVSWLAAISAGYIGHYLVYTIPQPFFIEDAGISFAFARNLVEGEGLVAYPGGERVEGYSNALWTFLVAIFYALGVPTWTSAKVMGAVFGVATLPFVVGITRRALPNHDDKAPILAAAMLAASPQFVIWNASGLENSLFCLLLGSGIYRLMVELEEDRPPLSALLFFLLTMTRPEGMAYAVFAGVALVLDAIAQRRGRMVVRWVGAFIVPWALYMGWRYWYFAWEFPNTYYGKLGKGTTFKPWMWDGGGWKYINKYFVEHRVVYVLPLLAFASAGIRGWRGRITVLVLALLAPLLFWDGKAGLGDLPDWWRDIQRDWVKIRVWSIAGTTALFGLLSLGRPGWRVRGLLWLNCSFGVFFALYAKGDWMKAHRWFNLVSISLMPLLAIGLADLLSHLPNRRVSVPATWGVPRRLREGVGLHAAIVAVVCGLWVISEAEHANNFANNPETAVRDIHRRVKYMGWIQRRLDVDDITLLDVDMGAHMYFTDWQIVDIAGLVDVPMARHSDFNMDFVREYLFEERVPDFAHVHAGWARSSKIPKHKAWQNGYLELPGYPIGRKKLHIGNHVRKALFVDTKPEGVPPDAPRFAGGVNLASLSVPSPEVAPGGWLFIDAAFQAAFREDGFRILAVLDDGQGNRSVSGLAPGYDWYTPSEWKVREWVHGRYRVRIPKKLAHGSYELGFVILDEKTGEIMPWEGTAADAPPPMPDVAETDEANQAERDLSEDLVLPPPPTAHPDIQASAPSTRAPDDDAPLPTRLPPTATPPTEEPPPAETASAPAPAAPATLEPYRYLPGEYFTGIQVQIVSKEDAKAAAAHDIALAKELSEAGTCEDVWPTWKNAARHRLSEQKWVDRNAKKMRTVAADCFVRRAAAETDRAAYFDALVQARHYDHRHSELIARGKIAANELDDEGNAAWDRRDWDGAYTAWALALKLDPTKSWVRRKAEDARDLRLDITRPKRESPEDGTVRDILPAATGT